MNQKICWSSWGVINDVVGIFQPTRNYLLCEINAFVYIWKSAKVNQCGSTNNQNFFKHFTTYHFYSETPFRVVAGATCEVISSQEFNFLQSAAARRPSCTVFPLNAGSVHRVASIFEMTSRQIQFVELNEKFTLTASLYAWRICVVVVLCLQLNYILRSTLKRRQENFERHK